MPQLEIIVCGLQGSQKELAKITTLSKQSTVEDLLQEFRNQDKRYRNIPHTRQAFRLEPGSKNLKPTDKLGEIKLTSGGKIFYKDLGPQIGWKTVFIVEYAGPLVIYLWFYLARSVQQDSSYTLLEILSAPITYLWGVNKAKGVTPDVVHYAAFCWTLHYAKRLLETQFIHRFSNETMPLRNIFKNCGYYWGFTAYIAYFVNHPKYLPPTNTSMILAGLVTFLLAEFGNFSIHLALRDLRPAGSKVRQIPYPTSNPFTSLFSLVCCPNYTYEFLAWASFAAMTQSLPAVLFACGGLYQMSVWALNKQVKYRKEFPNFPRQRKAILPFLV